MIRASWKLSIRICFLFTKPNAIHTGLTTQQIWKGVTCNRCLCFFFENKDDGRPGYTDTNAMARSRGGSNSYTMCAVRSTQLFSGNNSPVRWPPISNINKSVSRSHTFAVYIWIEATTRAQDVDICVRIPTLGHLGEVCYVFASRSCFSPYFGTNVPTRVLCFWSPVYDHNLCKWSIFFRLGGIFRRLRGKSSRDSGEMMIRAISTGSIKSFSHRSGTAVCVCTCVYMTCNVLWPETKMMKMLGLSCWRVYVLHNLYWKWFFLVG